jgi:glycosyltransferase involved in cell wall biosynthesis
MFISVIICTHNPRPDFFRETLNALERQTHPRDGWELLLVDNASRTPLAGEWSLAWHPQARHLREERLGLTAARLCGIREARGEVFVFVDDDNLLAPDYLATVAAMARDWPMLGVWGGQIKGRFEAPPPAWAGPYLGLLAIREFDRDRWSNRYDDGEAHPCGAGMVVRGRVAEAYAENVRTSELRLGLGRKGSSLASAEDVDMAFTAIDLGLGIGVFKGLHVTHLMPAGRLEEPYLLRLAESAAFSRTILYSLRRHAHAPPSRAREFYELFRLVCLTSHRRRFEQARLRGTRKAHAFLRSLHQDAGGSSQTKVQAG